MLLVNMVDNMVLVVIIVVRKIWGCVSRVVI